MARRKAAVKPKDPEVLADPELEVEIPEPLPSKCLIRNICSVGHITGNSGEQILPGQCGYLDRATAARLESWDKIEVLDE